MANITEVRLTLAALIYSIENDLKMVIKNSIVPYHNSLSFFKDTLLADKTKERFAKENPGVDTEKSISDIVEFLDFADIFKVILKNEDFVPVEVFNSISKLRQSLENIIPVRNRVMHTRPLLSGDFGIVYSFATDAKYSHSKNWPTLILTLDKIEHDPSYVLTLKLPVYSIEEQKVVHNLPYPDFDETGLIGRVKEVEAIKKLILSSSVVSVIGDGGIGKTALMVKVAYDIIDMKENCPFDIVIWVSAKTTMLTNKGIEDIVGALSDYTSIIENIVGNIDVKKPSLSDNLSTILEYLDVFKVLIIMDNLETIQTDEILNFIRNAQTKCKIAITSRIGLGELEYRQKLEGLSDNESAKMIREISRIRNNTQIQQLPQEVLVDVSRKLYHNPLAIKWFVNSVNVGKTPHEVLSKKDELLEFCLSNVYDKISSDGLTVLNVIRSARRPVNEAEIIFLSRLKPLDCRKAIIDLLSTTLINREIVLKLDTQDVKYQVSDFANEYLLKYHPVSGEFVKDITKKYKELGEHLKDIKYRNETNEFGLYAVEIRTSDEKVVSRYLIDALSISRKEHYDLALDKLDEAKSILPNYFEIYRISAFIKAVKDDLLGADKDYITALEIEPNDVRTLYYYAQFLLFKMEDIDSATEYVEKLHKLRPNHTNTVFLQARLYSSKAQFSSAIDLLEEHRVNKLNNSSKDWRVATSDIILNYIRWVNKLINVDQNYKDALAKLRLAVEAYSSAYAIRNIDHDLSNKLCKVLLSFVTNIPKIVGQDELRFFIDTARSYQDYIALSDSYRILIQKINDIYEINIGLSYVGITENIDKHKGLVIEYYSNRNYLFITSGLERIFAHKDEFVNIASWEDVDNGSVVLFDIGNTNGKRCAVNVVLSAFEIVDN